MVPAFKAKARPITNEEVLDFHLTYMDWLTKH